MMTNGLTDDFEAIFFIKYVNFLLYFGPFVESTE